MVAVAGALAERVNAEAERAVPPLPLRTRAKGLATTAINSALIPVFGRMGEPLAKLMTPAALRDPYPIYDELRSRGRLYRGKRIPLWIVTSWDVAHSITRDARFGVDARYMNDYKAPEFKEGDPLAELPLSHEMILRMDPPDHTRVRKLVSKAFTPRAIESWRGKVEEIANRLLDEVAASRRMDLVEDYAAKLPILVICELLGVPGEDHDAFRRWGDIVVKTLALRVPTGAVRASERAFFALAKYFEGLFADHRAHKREDLLSAMLAAEEDGEHLTHRELVGTCTLILLAGFETTVNLISNGTTALMANPEQLEKLRADESLMPNAVDELLRYDSPVQFTSRNVIEDLELEGQPLKRGQQIAVVIGAANNDPAVFADPRRLDLTRANASQHIAFSSGPHFCLGASLAKLEGEVAFETLLERCRDLRPAERAVRRKNELMRGFEHLPVAFTAA
jgi:hypothetical protein